MDGRQLEGALNNRQYLVSSNRSGLSGSGVIVKPISKKEVRILRGGQWAMWESWAKGVDSAFTAANLCKPSHMNREVPQTFQSPILPASRSIPPAAKSYPAGLHPIGSRP